ILILIVLFSGCSETNGGQAIKSLNDKKVSQPVKACKTFNDVFSSSDDALTLTEKIISSDVCSKDLERLVEKRKALLVNLIESDSAKTLEVKELPSKITNKITSKGLIEERGTFTGKIEVLHQDDFENPENSRYIYYLNLNNEKFELFSSEEFPVFMSMIEVELSGIALDNKIFVESSDSSIRVISDPLNSKNNNLGPQNTIAIIMITDENTNKPIDPQKVEYDIFADELGTLQNYYKTISFDKVSFVGQVVGPFIAPCESNSVTAWEVAIEAADGNVFFPDYNRFILVQGQGWGCGVGPSSTLGKVLVDTPDGQVFASKAIVGRGGGFATKHELGHSFGLHHSNYYSCESAAGVLVPFSLECNSTEYGDFYDVMGTPIIGTGEGVHFNAAHKDAAGWLTRENTVTVTKGSFLLKPLELIQPVGDIQQIRIPIDFEPSFYAGVDELYYSIEFRQPLDYYDTALSLINPDVFNGVLIHIAELKEDVYTSKQTNLLDMHPEQQFQEQLNVGESFIDEINGYKITLEDINPEGALVNIEQVPKILEKEKALVYYDFDNALIDRAGFIKDGVFGKNNTGTPIFAEDALFFDGSKNNYLEFGKFPNVYIQKNNEFTISAWIKFTDYFPGSIYEKAFYKVMELAANKEIKLNLDLTDGVNPITLTVSSDESLSKVDWHHVVGVFGNHRMAIYIDGVEKNSIDVPKGYYIQSYGGEGSVGNNLMALLDEFSIYAKSLSETEINEIYNKGRDVILSPQCGDTQPDGAVNIGDIVYLLNYIFKDGPEPYSMYAANVNGDDKVNVGDLVYLINYIFKGGAELNCAPATQIDPNPTQGITYQEVIGMMN
ncbi:MAG: hypothetical protein KKB31_00260, partial [Nanoarchaeota archaeon]|nr:hypothetical protein [Nanoarchaeota archaeon]